jgi:hypothetical protein
MSSLDKLAWEQKADEVFSMLLKAFARGRNVSHNTNSPGYAPAAAVSAPQIRQIQNMAINLSCRHNRRKINGLARIDHSLPAIPVEPFTRRVRVVLFEQERVEDAGASIGYPALTAGGTPMRMTVTAGVHYPGCSSTVARKGGHLIDLAWVEGHLWEPAARSQIGKQMADDPKSFGTSPGGGFSRFSLALAQSGISSPRLSLPKISSSWTSAQRAGGSF